MSIIQGTSKAAGGGYTIDQSLRLDGTGDMSRTVGSDGNLRKWTFAFWLKRSGLGTNGGVGFNVGGTYVNGDNRSIFRFHSSLSGGDDDWYWAERSGAAWREDQATSSMHRDPAAWAHYLCVWDTDGGTTPRARRYINGVLVSDLKSGTAVAANVDSGTNRAGTFQLFDQAGFPGREFEGYAADMYFLDGVAATPSDFGEFSSDTGQFVPIAYSGSFGSNGFYLDFADSSDLGKDVSGNGAHFTTSSLSSSAQVTDTPTNNFCVLSPIDSFGGGLTLSDGNLRAVPAASAYGNNHGTFYINSGKWVFECKHTTVFGEACGWSPPGERLSGSSDRGYFMMADGRAYDNVTNTGTKGASLASGDFRYVFYDADAQAMWFAHVDVSSSNALVYDNSATRAEIEAGTTTNAVFTSIPTGFWSPGIWMDTNGVIEVNFGQSAFSTTSDLPSGFNTLNTASLPDPVTPDPSLYFQTTLYTGNASTQEVNQSGNLTFEPGLVWIKTRSNAANHALFDQVRGVNKQLRSDSTGAEYTAYSDLLTSFDADGFTLGADATVNNVNVNTYTYAAWQWAADGTTGSSNTDGSITSTVSANTTSGFSICTFTGNQTSGATFGHGLNTAPKMVIIKERSPAGNNWKVGHIGAGFTKFIPLDTNAAAITDSAHWNDTAPSSTVVTLGNDTGINQNTATYVAYCFAEVEGYSAIGSYVGNGSTSGPFIWTGFKPSWVMLRRIDSGGEWEVSDRVRDPDNPVRLILQPNSSGTEWDATTRDISWLSNGFVHESSHADFNASGGTYIYMAFGSPFKTATAR